jgi:hypothetical protein
MKYWCYKLTYYLTCMPRSYFSWDKHFSKHLTCLSTCPGRNFPLPWPIAFTCSFKSEGSEVTIAWSTLALIFSSLPHVPLWSHDMHCHSTTGHFDVTWWSLCSCFRLAWFCTSGHATFAVVCKGYLTFVMDSANFCMHWATLSKLFNLCVLVFS